MRLRIDARDIGAVGVLIPRIRAHPGVRGVRWSPTARSLTLERTAGLPVHDILEHLPAAPEERAHDATLTGSAQRQGPFWRELALPALALGAGVLGIAPVSTPVIAVMALPIARRAARSLGRHHVSIDVLDAGAAALLLLTGDVLAAGVTVALVETGERIRARAAGQARHVLRNWMGADAQRVRVLRDGSEPRIAATEIEPGDRAVVYAGETMPVDGTVVAGTALVDARAWTGEVMPRPVREGDSVLAGSSVQDGRIVVEVTASGEATRAGRLAVAIEKAVGASTQMSDMAHRIADRFVVPVLLTGGVVLVGTGDVARLASMLIVDFGTGIRVSVPTAILTTMVAGARQGVLFRSGNAIEQLARIDTVVFDKTGTLTTGRPTVAGIVTAPGWDAAELLCLAAAAEGHLPHPLAGAVRRAARRRGLALPEPDEVRYRSGSGVVALVAGHRVLVGDRRLLDDEGIPAPRLEGTSSSVVMVAVDGRYAGRIRLQDRVRGDAAEVIDALRAAGIGRLWLATGDRRVAARRVARQLHLDGFTAGMMPEDKSALVRALRAEGRTVAVVGDGINDAVAMADANVGIAVTHGADLARETAEVVLSGDDLRTLLVAVELARNAMGLVRQNVAIVAAPNAVALALATMGRLTPLAATTVNNGSTLVAGLNALRPLRRGRTGPASRG